MEVILETERLIATRFTINDTSFILELLNTPGWLQFIGDRNVHTQEDAKKYLLNGPIKSYEENGFGLALISLKETHEPIGMCGLIKRETLQGVDIGFAFLPAFAGKGYAYEIASATISYAGKELKLPAVLAIVMPQNLRSIGLLEKIGFKFQKHIRFSDETEPLMLFSTNELLKNKGL